MRLDVRRYNVSVGPLSVEDGGGYAAWVPDLPGCISDGETPEEALENAYDAIACWIEGAEEAGQAIPQPTRRAA